ncbi:MAG: rod-binding protein [Desulfobacterales bacterium]
MVKGIGVESVLQYQPKGDPSVARLKDACAEFESLFLNYIMKSARTAATDSDLFGSDNGGEIIKSMFDETLSREIARGGGGGMGNLLFEQLRTRLKTA